ncbi:MAG: L-histidine N(alpha)-methyltransferase [Vicinamibacterales bacterium]|jgi:dimethylhistidine N-methyltransferase|nr:L-histidine N(alpha)-methyltransferase [Vicinamibacterales bacterium]
MAPTSASVLTPRQRFAEDVRRDLDRPQKRLQPQYLYDALGSQLFEAICELPEYRITRAERGLLAANAGEMSAGLASPVTLVELGGGSGEKLALLIEPLVRSLRDVSVDLVDVSATAIALATRTLGRFPALPVTGHEATYEDGLGEAVAKRSGDDTILVAFLGSNIGNLDPAEARAFLGRVRSALRASDRLVLGADLVKPEADLVLAYDDPLGVTAAFNKNLLGRINRELGANFDLDQFAHRAVWNASASRVEMHLESLCDQSVSLPGANCQVLFAEGESIWTESSYKYNEDGIAEMGAAAGFARRDQWVDGEARFAVTAFDAV